LPERARSAGAQCLAQLALTFGTYVKAVSGVDETPPWLFRESGVEEEGPGLAGLLLVPVGLMPPGSTSGGPSLGLAPIAVRVKLAKEEQRIDLGKRPARFTRGQANHEADEGGGILSGEAAPEQ